MTIARVAPSVESCCIAMDTSVELLRRPTITVAELGEVLGCGRNAAYAFVREGRIRSLRIGSRIVIPTAAVRELLGETTTN